MDKEELKDLIVSLIRKSTKASLSGEFLIRYLETQGITITDRKLFQLMAELIEEKKIFAIDPELNLLRTESEEVSLIQRD